MFQFQCSPLTTADGIVQQFEVAKRYQESSEDVVAVLVLDEIGLAEFSPDMPLKVLHGLLVDPPIPIVGVSNWALDAAKMNRAICLSRPSPDFQTLVTTGLANAWVWVWACVDGCLYVSERARVSVSVSERV